MKRFLLILLGLAIIVGGFFAFAISQINTDAMRAYLENTVAKLTGKPFILQESPKLSIIPLGVSIGQASWGMINGKPAAEGMSASIKKGTVRLEILPLLAGNIDIKEIRFESPTITFNPEKNPTSPSNGTTGSFTPFSLKLLSINDGSISLRSSTGETTHIKNLDISIKDFSPTTAADITCSFDIDNAAPSIQGTFKAAGKLRYNGATLQLDNTELSLLQKQGLLAPGTTITAKGNIEMTPKHLKIPSFKVQCDKTMLEGTCTVALDAVRDIQGSLKIANLDAAMFTGNTKNTPAPAAKNSPVAQTTVYPKVDLRIDGENLRAGGIIIPTLQTTITGKGGKRTQYVLQPLTATLATGGQYSGIVRISVPTMQWESSGTAKDIAIGPLQQALQNKKSADGTAELTYSLAANELAPAGIKKTLAGKGHLQIRNMQLHGLSLLPKGAPVQGGIPSHFSLLSVPFTAQKGIVSMQNIQLQGDGVAANGQGAAQLSTETCRFQIKVHALGMTIPTIISGPMNNLSYMVDPAFAGQLLMQAPGLLLESGQSAGAAADSATSGAGKKGSEAIKGIGNAIKGLFGK